MLAPANTLGETPLSLVLLFAPFQNGARGGDAAGQEIYQVCQQDRLPIPLRAGSQGLHRRLWIRGVARAVNATHVRLLPTTALAANACFAVVEGVEGVRTTPESIRWRLQNSKEQ